MNMETIIVMNMENLTLQFENYKGDCHNLRHRLTYILHRDFPLTHISLVSLLWDIGKQNSPRCEAAERGVPSEAILFAERIFIENLNKI